MWIGSLAIVDITYSVVIFVMIHAIVGRASIDNMVVRVPLTFKILMSPTTLDFYHFTIASLKSKTIQVSHV